MNDYQSVEVMPSLKKAPSTSEIQAMFDRLAARYDLFNRLTSLGLDQIWRSEAVKPLSPGMRVLDIGCGTGDLTLAARRRVGVDGKVLGIDFSENMLVVAREKLSKEFSFQGGNVGFERCGAEELPIPGHTFHAILSAFVLRNIYEHIDAILTGVYDSLVDGGAVSFVDITEPPNKLVKFLWKIYMSTAAVIFGKILFGRNYPTSYLTESANRFMKAPEFLEALKKKGFRDIHMRPFLFGVIVLYQGRK